MKPGRFGTTTTLFAALNVLDGMIIGQCIQRPRHEEVLRFVNAVERAVPAGNAVETLFAKLTTEGTMHRFVAANHRDPKPFVWKADPRAIIAATQRYEALN